MIRHSLLYFLVRAGTGILTIATLAVFTRLMSPQEYGVYALSMAMATMMSAIFFQWLSVAVGRFYPRHRDMPDSIMAAAALGYWASTATVALVFLMAFPFGAMFNLESSQIGIIFLITVALGRHNLSLQLANAQIAPLRFGLLSWLRSGAGLLIGLILIHYGAGGIGALLGVFAGLVLAVIAFNPEPRLNMIFEKGVVKKSIDMFRYGIPLTLNSLAIVVVDVSDRFMISGLLDTVHVAPYAAAYDFVQQSIGPIMNVLFLAAFPMVIQVLEVEGGESARKRIQNLGRALVGIGLPAVVGLSVLSGDLAEIVFGEAYRQDAIRIMPWLAVAIFIGCFKSYYLDLAFQIRHVTKYQGYIAVLMAAINVVLNIIFLPRYGVIAAAWATVAAFLIGALVSWRIGVKVYPLPSLGQDFIKCSFASGVMAINLFLLPSGHGVIWLLFIIACGVIIYLILAWILDISGCRGYLNAHALR